MMDSKEQVLNYLDKVVKTYHTTIVIRTKHQLPELVEEMLKELQDFENYIKDNLK